MLNTRQIQLIRDALEILQPDGEAAETFDQDKAAIERWLTDLQIEALPTDTIKRYLLTGEFDGEDATVAELLHSAGRKLDKACASEIFGHVAFEAENGQIYMLGVEGIVFRPDPAYLAAVLGDDEKDETDDG